MKTNFKLIILISHLKTLPGVLKLVRQVLQLTKRKRELALLNFFVKHEEKLANIDKEKALAAVAPEKKITDSIYRSICSRLCSLLEETMAGHELKNQPFQFKMHLARAYKKQGIDKHFFQTVKKGIEIGLPEKELERYQALAESSSLIYFHPNANLHIHEDYQQYFDDWYLNTAAVMALEGLKHYCISMSRKLINGFEPIAGLEENFHHFIQWIPTQVKELLIIQVFLKAANAVQARTLNHYLDFKKIFLDNLDDLYSHQNIILIHLVNVLNFISFPASRNKKREEFELYKIGVEGKFFLEAKAMAGHIFNNIVYLACEVKETTWAETFVANHLKHLRIDEKSAENVARLSACLIEFTKGNYAQVLSQVKDIKYSDLSFAIRKYTLQIKCLYELRHTDEYGDIRTCMQSFKEYLRRKQLSASQKKRFDNLLLLVLHMLEVPYERDKATIKKELEKVRGKVFDERWVVEKLTEM